MERASELTTSRGPRYVLVCITSDSQFRRKIQDWCREIGLGIEGSLWIISESELAELSEAFEKRSQRRVVFRAFRLDEGEKDRVIAPARTALESEIHRVETENQERVEESKKRTVKGSKDEEELESVRSYVKTFINWICWYIRLAKMVAGGVGLLRD